eukprot:TRINITY_DN86439_c0_g1_i1.p1 TRINITY_DN86439_c0_g1~~TRINITY_DN86439_c0_g1_i1.p1  ORF type:complete len:183 (+),score=25.14 TRINITY_DN86439_c0_g1_i1:24-572(+)
MAMFFLCFAFLAVSHAADWTVNFHNYGNDCDNMCRNHGLTTARLEELVNGPLLSAFSTGPFAALQIARSDAVTYSFANPTNAVSWADFLGNPTSAADNYAVPNTPRLLSGSYAYNLDVDPASTMANGGVASASFTYEAGSEIEVGFGSLGYNLVFFDKDEKITAFWYLNPRADCVLQGAPSA